MEPDGLVLVVFEESLAWSAFAESRRQEGPSVEPSPFGDDAKHARQRRSLAINRGRRRPGLPPRDLVLPDAVGGDVARQAVVAEVRAQVRDATAGDVDAKLADLVLLEVGIGQRAQGDDRWSCRGLEAVVVE